jgi:hypothetical protein
MKNVIVFQPSFGKEERKIYELNAEGKFYGSLLDPGTGFSWQKVADNINGFHFFDSVDEAQLYIKEKHAGVVEKSEADVFCPKCNRGYMACDHSDLEVFWSYKKTCACDHTFKIEGRQIILYNVVSD